MRQKESYRNLNILTRITQKAEDIDRDRGQLEEMVWEPGDVKYSYFGIGYADLSHRNKATFLQKIENSNSALVQVLDYYSFTVSNKNKLFYMHFPY